MQMCIMSLFLHSLTVGISFEDNIASNLCWRWEDFLVAEWRKFQSTFWCVLFLYSVNIMLRGQEGRVERFVVYDLQDSGGCFCCRYGFFASYVQRYLWVEYPHLVLDCVQSSGRVSGDLVSAKFLISTSLNSRWEWPIYTESLYINPGICLHWSRTRWVDS